MKILVVDDQIHALNFMRELLEGEGFHVFTCSESHESLKILEQNQVNCVITDLKMPILKGGDLIQIITKKYPKIPVIVLSGHIQSEEEILSMGAYAALGKPVNIQELVACIYSGIAECADQITFHFDHINLKKIKDNINVRLVKIALKKTDGNQLRASKLLGISRQSLIRYLKRYQVKEDYRPARKKISQAVLTGTSK